jgi:hypothetical protein
MHTTDFPTQIRAKLADTIEDIGQAMALLRESQDDLNQGNIPGARLPASDALEIISQLETRFSLIAAELAPFSEH